MGEVSYAWARSEPSKVRDGRSSAADSAGFARLCKVVFASEHPVPVFEVAKLNRKRVRQVSVAALVSRRLGRLKVGQTANEASCI